MGRKIKKGGEKMKIIRARRFGDKVCLTCVVAILLLILIWAAIILAAAVSAAEKIPNEQKLNDINLIGEWEWKGKAGGWPIKIVYQFYSGGKMKLVVDKGFKAIERFYYLVEEGNILLMYDDRGYWGRSRILLIDDSELYLEEIADFTGPVKSNVIIYKRVAY